MSEMSFARNLLKGDPGERVRLRRAPEESCFGFQIATNNIGEGVGAGKMALEAGASWLDLNCGCPIYGMPRFTVCLSCRLCSINYPCSPWTEPRTPVSPGMLSMASFSFEIACA